VSDFVIRKGDRLPELTATLKDSAGLAVDLTAATLEFHMRAVAGGTPKVDAAATVVSPSAGTVKYVWATADTDTAGSYYGEFEVTFGDGRKQSFPNPGYITISVTDELA
jgi:hypothetical protein